MTEFPDCSFILSVERGKLEAQAVLLVESLRRFGGRYAKCPVYAISPRPDRKISQACWYNLCTLGVEVITEDLLSVEEQYGTAARLTACAWAERNLTSEIIVSLDDDLFFLREPDFSLTQTDFLARPVDVKGICTTGHGDPMDPYWRKISDVCEVDYEKIPWLETTVDRVLVKASYNGGMVAVRRQKGIFQKAETMYHLLKVKELSPRARTDQEVFASTGFVGPEASRWWGSSQAVLSLAATQLETTIAIASANYNIPAHLINYGDTSNNHTALQNAILVHYHWLLDKEHAQNSRLIFTEKTLPGHVLLWLYSNIPLPDM